MATTTIRQLLVGLGVDSAAGIDGLHLFGTALDLTIGLMTTAVDAAVFLTEAIADVAVAAAETGTEIARNARKVGLTAEEYQELAFAAEQVGLSSTDLNDALVQQAQSLEQLEKGTGRAAEGYAKLGISQADVAGLSTAEVLKLTADRLAGVTDANERLAIATAIYGDEAEDVLLLLELTGAGMDALGEQARALGIILTDEQVAAAEAATMIWGELQAMLEGVRVTMGLFLLPTLIRIGEALRDWFVDNQALIAQGLERWVNVLSRSIDGLVRFLEIADDAVQRLTGWEPILIGLAGAFTLAAVAVGGLLAVITGLLALGLAAVFVGVAVALFPLVVIFTAVGAAIAAVVLIVDDLIVFFRGGDSVIGRFLERFETSEGILGSFARLLRTIIDIGVQVVEVLFRIGGALFEIFERTALPLLRLVGAVLVGLLIAAFEGLAIVLESVVIPALELFLAGLEQIVTWLDFALAKLAEFNALADLGLEKISELTGVNLTGGDAAGGEALGPTVAEATGATGGATTTTSTAVTIEGNTNTITGAGISAEEVDDILSKNEQERANATSAALEGGEA